MVLPRSPKAVSLGLATPPVCSDESVVGPSEKKKTELYHKYRPHTFKRVVGQEGAVKQLRNFLKTGNVPKATIFIGGSGSGKTTLARILATKLDCHEDDFKEINAASSRGIEMIRNIQQEMLLSAMYGPCRVWLIDEVDNLTPEAQAAFKKPLEDGPDHVYFMLATTKPEKVIIDIRTRCTPIKINDLTPQALTGLVKYVLEQEEKVISDLVIERLVEVCDGSARKVLVDLERIIDLPTETEQLDVLVTTQEKEDSFKIVKALVWERDTVRNWSAMAKILRDIDTKDSESLRNAILTSAAKELLKEKGQHDRAYAVLDVFDKPWDRCRQSGLSKCCYEVFKMTK